MGGSSEASQGCVGILWVGIMAMKNKLGKDKYIIFLDIDGTVFDGECVPEENKKAIARARAAGHKIFLNTGRAQCIVTKEILDAVKPDGVISAMGTAIFIGDDCIYSATLPERDAKYLIKYSEEHGIFAIIESIERLVSINGPAFLGQENFISSADELSVLYPDMKVSKISLMADIPEGDIEVFRTLFQAVYKHPTFTEIPPKGCNKATGIARVCEYYGADIAHTIAIGDSGNDDDMIKFAGIGVAMGNATEEIKAVADYVTLICGEAGVAHALEKILLI